ncbi:3-keto-disaccharide hydrolase [Planctomycetaceae bacterium SH139]
MFELIESFTPACRNLPWNASSDDTTVLNYITVRSSEATQRMLAGYQLEGPSSVASPGLGESSRASSELSLGLWLIATLCIIASPAARAIADEPPQQNSPAEKKWQIVPSGDGQQWEVSLFGGEGDVIFGDQSVVMKAGDPLTGVRGKFDFPKEDFEIELEGRRLSSFDFFCGLTFPVGEGHCSLILGGWSGAVVGLSSIDGEDASQNSTKRYMSFDNEKWYKVRVRVDAERVRCWVDEKQVVDQLRGEHKFGVRNEMDLSCPLGIAAFMCDAEFRNFRWRHLPK